MINSYVVENNIDWEPSSKQWFMEMSALSHLKDDVVTSTDLKESISLIYSDYRMMSDFIDLKKSTLKFRFLFWSMQHYLPIAMFYEIYIKKLIKCFHKKA